MVHRKTIEILQSDSPGCTLLEVLTIDLGIAPSLGTVKAALEMMASYVEDEVIIQRPYSDYDCTGASFTSHIERIKRELTTGLNVGGTRDEHVLLAIYSHDIRVDV